MCDQMSTLLLVTSYVVVTSLAVNVQAASSPQGGKNVRLDHTDVRSRRFLAPTDSAQAPSVGADAFRRRRLDKWRHRHHYESSMSHVSSMTHHIRHRPARIIRDLTSEVRVKRDVEDPRVQMMPKRSDWGKTNLRMWGKRHTIQWRQQRGWACFVEQTTHNTVTSVLRLGLDGGANV